MANRITSWCIDCTNAQQLADFWCQVLDWQVTEVEDGAVRIQPAPDSREAIDFLPVPDGPKTTKNRVHLDVNATDRDQAGELARLLADLEALARAHDEHDLAERAASFTLLLPDRPA